MQASKRKPSKELVKWLKRSQDRFTPDRRGGLGKCTMWVAVVFLFWLAAAAAALVN
jgi:hypothetical protein